MGVFKKYPEGDDFNHGLKQRAAGGAARLLEDADRARAAHDHLVAGGLDALVDRRRDPYALARRAVVERLQRRAQERIRVARARGEDRDAHA